MREWIKKTLAGQFMHPSGLAGAITGRMMARKNRGRIAWAVREMLAEPVARVLEIGYGPGVAIEEIRTRCPSTTIVGVDSSPVMQAQASRRNQAGVADGSICLHLVSATDYSGQEAPFDLVFSINALPFCENPAEVVANSAHWLRPGGRMVIVHQPPMKTLDETALQAKRDIFIAWLTEAGLESGRILNRDASPNPVLFVEAIKPRIE
jgi:trans-aconitate methyltransferase